MVTKYLVVEIQNRIVNHNLDPLSRTLLSQTSLSYLEQEYQHIVSV